MVVIVYLWRPVSNLGELSRVVELNSMEEMFDDDDMELDFEDDDEDEDEDEDDEEGGMGRYGGRKFDFEQIKQDFESDDSEDDNNKSSANGNGIINGGSSDNL